MTKKKIIGQVLQTWNTSHIMPSVNMGENQKIKTDVHFMFIPATEEVDRQREKSFPHGSQVSRQLSLFLITLRPRQDGRHFPDDTFTCIFFNENVWILINISVKYVPKGPINNIPALVQIMAWHRPGDRPLSEPMMVSLLTHICGTQPHWAKAIFLTLFWFPLVRISASCLCNEIKYDYIFVCFTTSQVKYHNVFIKVCILKLSPDAWSRIFCTT